MSDRTTLEKDTVLLPETEEQTFPEKNDDFENTNAELAGQSTEQTIEASADSSSAAEHLKGNVKMDEGATNGPRFGEELAAKISAAKNNGWGASVSKFVKEKKYPALAALGVALVIAAGLFAVNNATQNDASESLSAINQGLSGTEQAANDTLGDGAVAGVITDGQITQVATEGEGVTHLARKSVATYAEAEGVELNAEQRVYAEDYLKDLHGAQQLEVGAQVTFTTAQLQEAVSAAQGLSEAQLQNLKQYSAQVQF